MNIPVSTLPARQKRSVGPNVAVGRVGSRRGPRSRDARRVKTNRSSVSACPALSRETGFDNAPPWWVTTPPPQRPSLGSGLFCPGPSSLNRPHPPHSQAHRDFTAWRLMCDAFAVRERRSDPRVVPGFRCTLLPDMPSSPIPGSSTSICPRVRYCPRCARVVLLGICFNLRSPRHDTKQQPGVTQYRAPTP